MPGVKHDHRQSAIRARIGSLQRLRVIKSVGVKTKAWMRAHNILGMIRDVAKTAACEGVYFGRLQNE